MYDREASAVARPETHENFNRLAACYTFSKELINMGTVQKLFKSVLPSNLAKSMEAESREWMVRCNDCGNEISVWDAGGIRWKASGNPIRRIKCPKCDKVSSHSVYKKNSSAE